jgi:predicted nucleotidyltransferase
MTLPGWVNRVADELPYPVVFATVSGAHLYGFASVDSDVDIRAVHLLPVQEVVCLYPSPPTIERGGLRERVALDLVSHDLATFLRLLLKSNGNAAEQLLSPLVIQTTDVHAELVALAPGCLTRHFAHHYRGFAAAQWQLFEQTGELKPALYTLRVLLTGIHLMRTGEVVADIRLLWTEAGLSYVPDLIEAKRAGEHGAWPEDVDREQLARDVTRLHETLDRAATDTHLPERPPAAADLDDLLVRTRLATSAAR